MIYIYIMKYHFLLELKALSLYISMFTGNCMCLFDMIGFGTAQSNSTVQYSYASELCEQRSYGH